MDTTVKFFRDDFPGAPVLNGVAGSLIAVLDACLVTGFGLRVASSMVVTGGVATLTLPNDSKNANLLDSIILIDGASVAALNGEQRVTSATSTTLSFATTAASGTVSGTINVRTAPAGWIKLYAGTNKAAYKSAAVESLGALLRVDDTGTLDARVRGYEAMSDVDTGTGLFPTAAQSAGSGGYWAKSGTANATANRWDVFSDSRGIYYAPSTYSGSNATYYGQALYFFGDAIPHKGTDVFATCLLASATAPTTSANYGTVGAGTQQSASYWARSITGLGSATAVFSMPETGTNGGVVSGSDPLLGSFPPPDGKLRLSRMLAQEGAANGA
ncbi:MAG: hypothetical protein K2Y10_01885, partial [Burkholderiaceae bacterium]|nr:hypothetical protein [Burkholderiaceae bacterium]